MNGDMKAATALEEGSRISHNSARETALFMLEEMARMLPPKPANKTQAEASAERHHWKAARAKGDGLVQINAWEQVPCWDG